MVSPHLAIVGALLPLAGFAKYIRDMFRGDADPNRVSWALWALSPLIAFPAEVAQHARLQPALVTLALGLGPLAVLAVSLRRRECYWRLGRFDYICGALGVLALAGWAATRRGDVAITLSIAADALAAVPTVAKSYTHPESESPWTYLASGTGSGITLLTISHWEFAAYAFPAYVVVACALISALILLPRPGRRLTSRPIRLAAAAAAALVLLAATGFAGYQLHPGRAVIARTAQAAIPASCASATNKLAPRPVRPRHHRARPAAPAPDTAPVPPFPDLAPSRTRQPPAPPSPQPSPRPQPSPSATPAPSPTSSLAPSPTPTPSPSPTPTATPSPSRTAAGASHQGGTMPHPIPPNERAVRVAREKPPQDASRQPPGDGSAWRQWYANRAGQVIETAAQRARGFSGARTGP